MAEARTQGFRVLPSYYAAIRDLPDTERLMLYDAIWDYGFGNDVSELPPLLGGYFGLIQPTLAKSIRFEEKQIQNGSKGGRPPKPRQNPNKTQTKPKEEPTENLAIAVAVANDIAVESAVDEPHKPTEQEYRTFCDSLGIPAHKVERYWEYARNSKKWERVVTDMWEKDRTKQKAPMPQATSEFVPGEAELAAIRAMRERRLQEKNITV